MLFISGAFFLLTASAATATGNVPTSYIVGGNDTDIEKYGSVVQLEKYNQSENVYGFACAANILTEQYLLSSAQCLLKSIDVELNELRVRAGATVRGEGGVFAKLHSYLVHPDYNKRVKFDADIALLKLESRLPWSTTTKPSRVVPQGYELPDNYPVQVIGWGYTEHKPTPGSPSEILQEVTVRTVNKDVCSSAYPVEITDNMVCAGVLDEEGKEPCQGDSGGPLYMSGVLVGIVSWGYGCGNPKYPGVYTKVSAFTDWIVSNSV